MSDILEFLDLSPYANPLSPEDEAWLARVQAEVDPVDFLVRIGEEEEPESGHIVACDAAGRWCAGRYIGHLGLDGRRLVIKPRLGLPVIERWLDRALNLITPPASATRRESEAFIARLLARVWCHALDAASRHGPPGLRVPVQHESAFARGRLELRDTLRLRRRGKPTIASTASEKTLNHEISRTLVAAERALASQLSAREEWRTERILEVMPHLRAAVGSRPRLPRRHELSRMRYTPITLPFKRAVEISYRIASRRGFTASAEAGRAEGLLIDVAELWELFVLNCMRLASSRLVVDHGTTAGRRDHLLVSADGSKRGLARLLPDVLVRDGSKTAVAVVDAKYKRLTPTRERPTGVDRGDLYQLAAYLSRYGNDGQALGALAYPDDGSPLGDAALHGPWRTDAGNLVHCIRLPLDPDACTGALRQLIESAGGPAQTRAAA